MDQIILKAMHNFSTQWSQDQNQASPCNSQKRKHFFSTCLLKDQVNTMIGAHNMGYFAFCIALIENMGIDMVEWEVF